MSKNKVLFKEGSIMIKLEERNNRNRGKFRHLSRQVSGEVFDVPEDNQVIYIYDKLYQDNVLVGQLSFSLADLNLREPGVCFDSEYYSQITFLFIHRDFQGHGLGRKLFNEMIKIVKKHSDRPLRLQSAEEAVGFFEKLGFTVKGEPVQCCNSGSRLFRSLTNMERVFWS